MVLIERSDISITHHASRVKWFGDWVKLRASPSAASRIREMTNRGIVIDGDTPDGGVVARLRGTLDDTGRPLELVPWILGWGADLEVLEPVAVREAVAEALRRAAGLYQSP